MGRNAIINISTNIAGGVSAGLYRKAPWHGVGEVKDNKGRTLGIKKPLDSDPREPTIIRALADLTWEPQEISLSELDPRIISSQKMLARPDWPQLGDLYDLGVHSDKYGTLTNEIGVDFVAEILKWRDDAKLRSCTTLYGGKIIFAVIEFHDGIQVTRRNGEQTDKNTPYMGVYWSHDGSHPLGVKYMRHEWVCENTFTPWNAETGLVIRHTRYAEDRARDALMAVEGMVRAMSAFDVEIQRLLNIGIDEHTMKRTVMPAVIGPRPTDDTKGAKRAQSNWDDRFNAIVGEWREYTDQETAFDAVMAIQGYEQHLQPTRGGGRDVKTITRILRDNYPLTVQAAGVFATA